MSSNSKSTLTRIGAVALSGAVLVGFAAPALANGADVIRQGGCSGNSDWKLKASPENNRIEVEGEVDSNVNDQNWKWKMLHDGKVSARGTATTSGPSGSFDARPGVTSIPSSGTGADVTIANSCTARVKAM